MSTAGTHAGARIGPNAITRTAEALLAAFGAAEQARVFAAAGLGAHHVALVRSPAAARSSPWRGGRCNS